MKWNDGRQYAGYWANSKQHGLGVYYKPSEGKTKYGLWEDGKVAKWFNSDEEISNIYDIDYTQYFQNPDSSESLS